jgi:hypothetical protein
MSAIRKLAAVTAAVGLATLSLLPTVPAAASSGAARIAPASLPADCTYTDSFKNGFTAQSVTCTARPSSQKCLAMPLLRACRCRGMEERPRLAEDHSYQSPEVGS